MSPVFRIEAIGETAAALPSLAVAMQIPPRDREAYIATSVDGVHLADAFPVSGSGSMLRWRLTRAGQDVLDRSGWTAGAPTMSEEEYDTLLELALREDFESVA